MWGWMNCCAPAVRSQTRYYMESAVINDLRREGGARCQAARSDAQPQPETAGTIRTSNALKLLKRYRSFRATLVKIKTQLRWTAEDGSMLMRHKSGKPQSESETDFVWLWHFVWQILFDFCQPRAPHCGHWCVQKCERTPRLNYIHSPITLSGTPVQC